MLTLQSPVTIISILHVNARSIDCSISSHTDLISAEFICHDIISFTESWLTPRVSDNDMIIPGYKPPFRRDRDSAEIRSSLGTIL
jgi:hypothetical protein